MHYDLSKHNYIRSGENKSKDKINIIDEKLKCSSKLKNKNDISKIFGFNIVESIR